MRALFAFLGIAAMGFPLYRLTRTEAVAVESPAEADTAAVTKSSGPSVLQLTFTAKPKKVAVTYLGKEIWSSNPEATELEQKLPINFPKEGVDLEFTVDWPGDDLAAMRAVLTDPEGTPHERIIFGKGRMSEVLTFQ